MPRGVAAQGKFCRHSYGESRVKDLESVNLLLNVHGCSKLFTIVPIIIVGNALLSSWLSLRVTSCYDIIVGNVLLSLYLTLVTTQ